MSALYQGVYQGSSPSFFHKTPSKPQLSTHQHREIIYGAKVQMTHDKYTSALDEAGIKRIQDIVGAVLFYVRAI